MDDRSLVQGLLRNEPEAQQHLDRTYRPRLYRACCHLLGYRDPDAEDVVQETFLAALKQLPKFEFRSSLYRWLFHICMYQCFQVIRRRKRLVTSMHEELEERSVKASLDRREEEEREKRLREDADTVRRERDGLEEPCRGMLRSRMDQGLTYGELADSLRVPVGTVMSRLARCMELLKKKLAKRLKADES